MTRLETRGFSAEKRLNNESHPITADYVLPKPAPHSALPDIIAVIETPRVYQSPLAPAAFARSARLAPLTTLRPRWRLALFEWLRLQ